MGSIAFPDDRFPGHQKFRHEFKYLITRSQIHQLSRMLRQTMLLDPFADEFGNYHIRSLYFDNVFGTSLNTKWDGVLERKKYRIRIYNLKDDNIKFECKHKIDSYICKRSITLTRPDCDRILKGDPKPLLQYDVPLAREIYVKIRSERLKPAVIVDYVREAYVSPIQEVRVTLDKRLATGAFATDMFDPKVPVYPMLDDYDGVLEVKFHEHLPVYFRSLIQIGAAQQSAVSKYVMGRRYEVSAWE